VLFTQTIHPRKEALSLLCHRELSSPEDVRRDAAKMGEVGTMVGLNVFIHNPHTYVPMIVQRKIMNTPAILTPTAWSSVAILHSGSRHNNQENLFLFFSFLFSLSVL